MSANKHSLPWRREPEPSRRPRTPYIAGEEYRFRLGFIHGARAVLKAVYAEIRPDLLAQLNNWQLVQLQAWLREPQLDTPAPKAPQEAA